MSLKKILENQLHLFDYIDSDFSLASIGYYPKDREISKILVKETPEYKEFEIIYESFEYKDCNCHPETCCHNKNGWTKYSKKVKEYKN